MATTPTAEVIRERCRAAGLVGCGGGGFPTHAKLERLAEVVIANAAECEPLLIKDTRLCEEAAELVLRGLELAAAAVGARRRIVAAKPKRREAWRALRAALGEGVELVELADAYPVGDEVVLIETVTGRRVPRFGLPGDVGVLVLNVETLAALARAVDNELPFTHKQVCVVGAVGRPLTVRAPLGYPAQALLKAAGWDGNAPVLEGGPLMGGLLDEPAVGRVSKTTAGYTVLPPDSPIPRHLDRDARLNRRLALSACTQCRYCTDLCPRWLAGQRVRPHRWMRALALNLGLAELAGEMWACSGCGVCELYACPEGLSPRRVALELREGYPRPDRSVEEPEERSVLLAGRRPPTSALLTRLGLADFVRPTVVIDPPPTERLVLALQQGTGYPAEPNVAVNDQVTAGQLLAEATARLAVPLHAPLDGRVSVLDSRQLALEVSR
ncbi:MAG: 4Fe-4S dicluster domain-containing protein [Candidatus Coatesbacteria bacterium]|nr:4Fe-4S dicluster domain-containing protein [Candidatus Coatesbacteria bacterium]